MNEPTNEWNPTKPKPEPKPEPKKRKKKIEPLLGFFDADGIDGAEIINAAVEGRIKKKRKRKRKEREREREKRIDGLWENEGRLFTLNVSDSSASAGILPSIRGTATQQAVTGFSFCFFFFCFCSFFVFFSSIGWKTRFVRFAIGMMLEMLSIRDISDSPQRIAGPLLV